MELRLNAVGWELLMMTMSVRMGEAIIELTYRMNNRMRIFTPLGNVGNSAENRLELRIDLMMNGEG